MAAQAKRNVMLGYLVTSQIAFVPHPDRSGLWMRVHPCVLRTACEDFGDVPGCGAAVGEPCFRDPGGRVTALGRYQAGAHWTRHQKVRHKPLLVPPFPVYAAKVKT